MFDQIQSRLLDQVKRHVDPRLSYVDELAELLNLSRDSVYRRIRGETELSLKESLIICEKFGLSLHELAGNQSNLYTFTGRIVDKDSLDIYRWLQVIYENLSMLEKFPGDKRLIYYTKDLPVFYYFNYPHLSAFKMYFWMRTIHKYPEFESKPFSIHNVPQEMIALGQRIWKKFCQVPSIEIWAQETIMATLRQIEYYHDCGYFEDPSEMDTVFEEFEKLIFDSRSWLKAGYKPDGASLEIYRNDILLGDNTILFKYGNERTAFLPIGSLSIVYTSNPGFTRHVESFLDTVIQRAVLISSTGEKERNRYLNQNMQIFQAVKKRLYS